MTAGVDNRKVGTRVLEWVIEGYDERGQRPMDLENAIVAIEGDERGCKRSKERRGQSCVFLFSKCTQ